MNKQEKHSTILNVDISEQMKDSYLTYAMSVIISRALPDVRDGLKPVHRRILYAMHTLGLLPNGRFRKSATIIGEVLGKYHPHGDASVYAALARLTQDFSMRYPLIKGQGNFGSVDGDPPAASRYTEAKMEYITLELLRSIGKDTVDMRLNYDESTKEPVVLPNRIPNLLLNGSSGIAVGMMTNIPPHNLAEVVDATCMLIKNPDSTIEELMEHIKGPDFPSGGIICGTRGIYDMYKYGRGKLIIRAKISIEERSRGLENIVISEFPYQVNKAETLAKIASLVKEKRIEGISDIRDESDRHGIRAVIELKKGALSELILNQLYAQTNLQNSFGVIMLALVSNRPKILDLKSILNHYIKHAKEVNFRETQFDLKKAQARLHIILGLILALEFINEIVQLIKSSKDAAFAKKVLMESYTLTEIQAQAILDMRLQRLTSLETNRLIAERKDLDMRIEKYTQFLSTESLQYDKIYQDLVEIKNLYKDLRRTDFYQSDEFENITTEDLIPREIHAVIITQSGYIKRFHIDMYRRQRRGGVGASSIDIREDDMTKNIYISSTHNYLAFFTNLGRVFFLKVYQIALLGKASRGQKIENILKLLEKEFVQTVLEIKDFEISGNIFLITRKGIIKRLKLSNFIRAKKRGMRCINIDPDDHLVSACLTDGSSEFLICTKRGLALRFSEQDVRIMGRAARGVIGIRLKGNNVVIGLTKIEENKTLFIITKHGFGKRIHFNQIKKKLRGGYGQIYIRISEKTGSVVDVQSVSKEDEIMIITRKGMLIKILAKDVSRYSRSASGMKIIQLKRKADSVVATSSCRSSFDDPYLNLNGEEALEKNTEVENTEALENYQDNDKNSDG